MRNIFFFTIIILFGQYSLGQEAFQNKELLKLINVYEENNIEPKIKEKYKPIILNLEQVLDSLTHRLNKENLKTEGETLNLLVGTNYLGNILWSELWIKDKIHLYAKKKIKENDVILLDTSFPLPLLEFKEDVENWNEVFLIKSDKFSDIADASYFIAIKGIINNVRINVQKIKFFIEY